MILHSSTLFRLLSVGFVLTGLGAGAAAAQTPDLLGQDKDWGAYMVEKDGGKTCYTLSMPKSQAPKNVNRDQAYFFVTFRPKDKIRNQISVIIGYPFENGSSATVEIGSAKFTLFTKDDKAWIDDIAEQDKLVAAMKGGSSMTVRGRSQRGTNTTDSYSLSGITASLGRIANSCK
jgi:hypothetical protein